MKKNIAYVLLSILAFAIVFIYSCANRIALTGGPRDEVPPVLDTSASFQNNQILFKKSDIELIFNEFINLRNPSTQVVISPPLNYPPKIEGRAKKVTLKFNEEEVLKDNATYIVNFGESITDFTEGNKLENFTLVFSTGLYIDSLSLRGKVTDAYSRKERPDVLVMMYDTFEDSIVYRKRPFYFAKTQEDGQFEIRNIRADTFKVLVLADLNLNYLFDPASEEIGFLDSLIIVSHENQPRLDLEIFKEKREPRYIGYEVEFKGKLVLEFDQEVPFDMITPLDSMFWTVQKNPIPSKLDLWYLPTNKSGIRIEIKRATKTDTVTARINLRNTKSFADSLSIVSLNDNGRLGLHPDENLEIQFSRPVSSWEEDRIIAVDTLSGDTLVYTVDSSQILSRTISLAHKWAPGSEIILTFYPGSFKDIFGISTDTLVRPLKVAEREDFGEIRLGLGGLDSTIQYYVELVYKNRVKDSRSIALSQNAVTFDRLAPGDYELRVIEDMNGNKQWDPGRYDYKLQSENIYIIPLEGIRNNWTLEAELIDLIINVDNDEAQDR